MGADFRFQSESTHVDTRGHPPVSGKHQQQRPPRLLCPHPRLGGKGRRDPLLILNAGWSGPQTGPRGCPSPGPPRAPQVAWPPRGLMSVSLLVQASEVMMQGGKLLALVIIMLSALEEQVSGLLLFSFFFGVFFNYLKKRSKRTVTAKLSSRYCSLRITKANAVTRRMGEKRQGCFWSLATS